MKMNVSIFLQRYVMRTANKMQKRLSKKTARVSIFQKKLFTKNQESLQIFNLAPQFTP